MPVGEVPAQGSAATPSPDGQGNGLGDGTTAEAGTASVPQADTAADAHGAASAAAVADRTSYGPVAIGTGIGVGGSVDDGHRAASARAGHVPAHAPVSAPAAPGPARRGPAGDGDGVLCGGASVLDAGASRHGDTHAVTTCHRVPLRLVPGSTPRTDPAGTRDRHRNIPVFPG